SLLSARYMWASSSRVTTRPTFLNFILSLHDSLPISTCRLSDVSLCSNWVPGVYFRWFNFCSNMGTNCLGQILGLGSKRSLGAYYLVFLCGISPSTFITWLAR